MAIGRISIKSGSKGKAVPHANYILRQDKYKPHASKLEKLEHTSHGNMPDWAKDNPKIFWQMADEHERKNGSTYREHILTLPRELNPEQRLELVKEWIKNELGDKHPYSLAIHTPLALDGKEQPHAHLMFCERELDGVERGAETFFKRYNSKDPSKGGAKKSNTGLDYTTRKTQIKEQRTRWGDLVNKHLELANSKSRVDMRNYKERNAPKPLNIPMKSFQMPDIKKAYTDKLLAKLDFKQALFTEYKALNNGDIANELSYQLEKLEHEEEMAEVERLMSENPSTPTHAPVEPPAPTVTDGGKVNERISPPPVAPVTPEPPPPPKIVLNQRQQVAYNISLKYGNDDTPENRADFAELTDSELKRLENPYQDEHNKFESLVRGTAKAEYDSKVDKIQKQIDKLVCPPRPVKGENSRFGMESDKAYTKRLNDYLENDFRNYNNARRAKDIEISNINGLPTHAHRQAVIERYPDLAQAEQDYNNFEQFKNEVERALRELDKQQKQVRQSDIDR